MFSLKTVVILTNWLTLMPFLGGDMQHRQFYKMEGKSLIGNVTAVRNVRDFIDCSFVCLRYGPYACLSFNLGRTSDNGLHPCELVSTERYLELHKIQDKPSYDYYGTTTDCLYRLNLAPCASNPCNYGGTCTHGPRVGEFSCQCTPEVTVLPFIDNRCNVDDSNLQIIRPTEGVFHARVSNTYLLTYYDAQRVCELLGATLATYSQLSLAWEAGLEWCQYGWLVDRTARFPMHQRLPHCGNFIGVGGYYHQANADKYNAWCFKE